MTIHPRSKCLWAVVVAGATIAPGAAHAVESASPRISPEFAAARAVNDLSVAPGGFTLRNPRHAASFDAEEVVVTPRRGPAWTWRFTAANAADASRVPAVADPASPDPLTVTYHRGPLDEIYRCEAGHIEQEFRLTEGFALSGPDLVIAGTVECAGDLRRCEQGWVWSTEEGVVSLGNVRVFDATGRSLSAAMSVDGSELRIVVGGDDLRTATFPVTVDPEIGTNDFRLSDMGPDGDITFDGFECAVAYNNLNNEFLVVWEGDDDVAGLSDGEFEIFGQRIDGTAGGPLGANDFRISDMGPDGVLTLDAVHPAVTYNRVDNEYLVVWSGDDGTPPLVDGEFEIFGQRLAGTTGAEIGANDFRISSMGPDGNPLFDASDPDVVYDAILDQYLVVWSGDDVTDDEHEIHGQRLAGATGAEIGADDFRVSDMGPDGDPLFDAEVPRAALSTSAGEYLVVWQGDDDSGLRVNGEFEIHGQRITASTGAEVGANDFRISDMGPDGDAAYDAQDPSVSYAAASNRFLVAWSGDDNTGSLVEAEREIFGQFLDGTTGAEIGANDFRISDMGPDGDVAYDAQNPFVLYNAAAGEFLVAWHGDDKASGGLGAGEIEIFAQRVVAATGVEVGTNDFRLSEMGTAGNIAVGAAKPAIAVRSVGGSQYLVAWHADSDTLGTVEGEFEIYGQLVSTTGVEFGANDFRISDMGPDGDIDFDARSPAIAYDGDRNQYLVVWEGDDDAGTLVDGETEIFGQRVDALTGAELGSGDFRISDMGPDGDPLWDAQKPAVAYNPVNREFLVVWSGEDDAAGLANGEFEIYAQRIAAATGAEIGTNDFRISDMGPDGDPLFDALDPSVAFNAAGDEYLVVWAADDLAGTQVEGETEIFGQRLAGATGAEIGTNDFRITDVGPDGDPLWDAAVPQVAYNPAGAEYLVVFAAEDNIGLLANGEFEIYGQRLGAAGAQIGANDFRISSAGVDGDATYDAFAPAVAFDPVSNRYLVVWEGEDTVGLLAPDENEIFGQLLGAGGVEVGPDDFRISDMGPDGDPFFDAEKPSVAYNTTDHEFLVTWTGDDDTLPIVDGEKEVWVQRVDANGLQPGINDERLSDVGPNGDPNEDAEESAVAYASPGSRFLVVWRGDDDLGGPLGTNEFEIYGQLFSNMLPVDVATVLPPIGPGMRLAVTPNPARDDAHISLTAPSTGPVEVTVVDVAGRVRFSRVVPSAPSGRIELDLPSHRLASGVYFVRAAGRGLRESTKLTVLR